MSVSMRGDPRSHVCRPFFYSLLPAPLFLFLLFLLPFSPLPLLARSNHGVSVVFLLHVVP
eukprot:GDKH01021911.1.p3 GENE.GDKH01021911.1~~GDKH01021911.1.p3  ORF type:complete len:60 (-),score=0.78 GDKH01021911.1:18-197(-)